MASALAVTVGRVFCLLEDSSAAQRDNSGL